MADQIEQWLAELLRLNDEEETVTDKQIKIIQAAVEMFAEKGYAAASTSEIAQRAGVAEGTIFRHYKTKKELLMSIVVPTMSRLVAPFLLRDFYKVLDSEYNHFEDFIRSVMRNRLEFALKNDRILKIMLHEIPFQPELQVRFKELVVEQVAARVERVVRHFQDRGELINLPPFTLIRMTVSVIISYIFTRCFLLPDNDWNDELEIDRTVDFIMFGLTPRS